MVSVSNQITINLSYTEFREGFDHSSFITLATFFPQIAQKIGDAYEQYFPLSAKSVGSISS
jgi:hypothetical protein